MKKTKSMRLAVLAASLLCCSIFTIPAYAQSSEPQEKTPPAQEAPAETEAQPETQNPFSTDGTGTVVDKATDEEGKEFYTITTPDENIFYLVIDKQKTTDNVYFLNAVTEADLLPLAEKSEEETAEPAPEPEPEPEPTRPRLISYAVFCLKKKKKCSYMRLRTHIQIKGYNKPIYRNITKSHHM